MNDNAVMTRRTKVTRITQGDGLPPPLVVATAQQEERRTWTSSCGCVMGQRTLTMSTAMIKAAMEV